MRRNNLISLISALFISLGSYAQLYHYNLPFEREYGKQKVRGEFISYRTVKQAWAKTKDSLENASILNGTWKTTTTSDTARAVRTSDVSSWTNIAVPSISSDKKPPIFTADKMPVMEESLNMIPSDIFTVFRTDFIIPFDYLDKAIFMHIGAVTGKTSVYVNGKKVAVLRESFIPQEVKISDATVRGKNSLTLVMDPYNEESLMERWDSQFNPSVPGNVYVFAQPKIRMYDFMHKTTLDPTYKNGLLEAALILKTELINTHMVTVYYDLYDMNGKIVNSDYKDVEIGWYKYDTIRFMSSIKDVNLWSASHPYLYTIVYRVKREGRTYENVIRKVGFRQIETNGNDLLINGIKEPIYGINADLFPEFTTQISSIESMSRTMKELRSNGYNAIRTPYPLREEFYDLADKYGFYISETAPNCSKGLTKSKYMGGTLANNPAWSPVYVSRVVDTYEKGKSHTSIIMWELGEECGNGCAMYDAYNALRELEQYRPITYSDGGYEWNSDICTNVAQEKVKGVDKPFIPVRMKYDKEYWNTNQGGFIDERIDGRIGNSTYTMNPETMDNLKGPATIQPSPNLWDKIKDTTKKKPKEKKSLLGKKGKKVVATAATAETLYPVEKEPVSEVSEQPMVPVSVETPESLNYTIKVNHVEGSTYEITNGLDKNLNNYKIIHAVMEESGKLNPVELLTIDLEPGKTKTITLTKTNKNKKAFLLIGGITKVEL